MPGRTECYLVMVVARALNYAGDNRRSKQNTRPTKFGHRLGRWYRSFNRHCKIGGRRYRRTRQ